MVTRSRAADAVEDPPQDNADVAGRRVRCPRNCGNLVASGCIRVHPQGAFGEVVPVDAAEEGEVGVIVFEDGGVE
jgi:hypothetical protein